MADYAKDVLVETDTAELAEPGWGRELFAPFRAMAGEPEQGGGIFGYTGVTG